MNGWSLRFLSLAVALLLSGMAAPAHALQPDIRVNGSGADITVDHSTPVSVGISLDAGANSGQVADWWVYAVTPYGNFSYVYPTGWTQGITVAYQGPLFSFPPEFEVLNLTFASLQDGDYPVHFSVDLNPNGILDAAPSLVDDFVTIHVTSTCTDADADGYSVQGGACGPIDCNDSNPLIYPGATETCGDGIDQDCSGSDLSCSDGESYQVNDLAGLWFLRGVFTPQNGQPDNFGYRSSTFTIQSVGTYSGLVCDDASSCQVENGSAGVGAQGNVIMWPGASLQLGVGKNVMIGNYLDNDEYAFDMLVRKASNYAIADLAGSWYLRSIGTQRDGMPDHYGFDTGSLTFQSNGAYSGQVCDDGGACRTESGTATVTPAGKVTLWSGLTAELNEMKNIIIGSYKDTAEYQFDILVKRAASYATSDLQGTWVMKGLSTGQNNLADNFGYDTCTLTFQSNGAFSGTCRDQNGASRTESGQAYVLGNGTVNIFGEESANMASSKDVIIGNRKGTNEYGLDVFLKISGN